jgi:hypothetical protein
MSVNMQMHSEYRGLKVVKKVRIIFEVLLQSVVVYASKASAISIYKCLYMVLTVSGSI